MVKKTEGAVGVLGAGSFFGQNMVPGDWCLVSVEGADMVSGD